MSTLIINSSKIGARLALIAIIFSLIITLCTVIFGETSLSEQCFELMSQPIKMAEELIENLPFISKLPFLQNIVTAYSAVSTDDAQQTIFKDIYFALLSVLIIYPTMCIFNFFKNFVGKTDNSIIFTVCDAICNFVIAYAGTGIAIVISNRVILSVFKSNYIAAFLVLLILQLIISAFKTFLGIKGAENKGNLFLTVASDIFVNLLFEVSIFTCVLYGNAILFKGLIAIEAILWFLFSLGAMVLSVIFKMKYKF